MEKSASGSTDVFPLLFRDDPGLILLAQSYCCYGQSELQQSEGRSRGKDQNGDKRKDKIRRKVK